MKIYLVTGQSFTVPGRPLKPFATTEQANAEAASMVNILREEVDLDNSANADNWMASLEEARAARMEESGLDPEEDELDAEDDGYVEIVELDMPYDDPNREDAERWRALMSSQRMHIMGFAGFDAVNPADPEDYTLKNLIPTVKAERGKDWAHFGMEFWSEHPAYGKSEFSDGFERRLLVTYVDHLRGVAGSPPPASVADQMEWLKARLADLQIPSTKRDHDTREKWLLECGMPEIK